MKKATLVILTILLTVFRSFAQDIITLTNGTRIEAKVLEINPDDIKYKDYKNQDGPMNTILKTTVASIQYANGVRTLFNESSGDKPRSGTFKRGNGEGDNKKYSSSDSWKKNSHKARIEGWYWGVNFDLGISNLATTDPYYTTSSSTYVAINFLATDMFDPHFGIQFGLGEQGYNYGVTFNGLNGASGSGDFSVSYLSIPVRALYFSNSKEPVGFYATAGLDLSLRLAARDNQQEDLTSYFNSTAVNIYASCGVEFRTRNDRVIWMIGPYMRAGLTEAYSDQAVNINLVSGSGAKLNSFGVSVVSVRNRRTRSR